MANLYGVFDGDKLVFEGTATEVANKYEMYDRMTVYNYANRDWKIHRKYTIRFLRKTYKKLNEHHKKQAPTEREQRVANAITMMKVHGNLYCKDHEEYRKELEDEGIYYTYRPCMDGKGFILERVSYEQNNSIG